MEEQSSSKKIIIIVGGVVLLLIIIGVVFFMMRSKSPGTGTTSFGALFGSSGTDVARPTSTKINDVGGSSASGDVTTSGDTSEPLFRQLTTTQVAGGVAVVRGGVPLVRYVARENGYVYDVDPKTGKTTQLTNTTIPRIYEAYFANTGNTVILRYLKHDDLSRKDIIKTQIADLVLPLDISASSTGSLLISETQLPDNISAVSISPSGNKMFYLLPVSDGISGTVVNVTTKIAVEVLRNSFSEWLPQMLDSGNIILTTKASANAFGYSYLYDTSKKTLTRLVREKNGLTTLATPAGERMLYSENILGVTNLGLYDQKGFAQDEGEVSHTASLQLATLPEKCVWSGNRIRAYCGAFASTPRAQIPDDWYQGALAFSDTFWTTDTDLADLVFLADPNKETGKTLDVFIPFIDKSEEHFFFVDKNDSTLWSMRLERSKYTTVDELPFAASSTLPVLTPAEMRDAAGSMPTTTSVKTKVK